MAVISVPEECLLGRSASSASPYVRKTARNIASPRFSRRDWPDAPSAWTPDSPLAGRANLNGALAAVSTDRKGGMRARATIGKRAVSRTGPDLYVNSQEVTDLSFGNRDGGMCF